MIAFARIRRPQAPIPRQTQTHVPHHRDPRLRLLRLRRVLFVLPAPHAFRFLFPILGRLALTVVLGAKLLLVGFRSRRGGTRTIEGDRNPTRNAIELSSHSRHALLQHPHQNWCQVRRPRRERSHEALIRRQRRTPQQRLTPSRGFRESIGHMASFRPRPTQRQQHEARRGPRDIAMKTHLCEDTGLGKQPLVCLPKALDICRSPLGPLRPLGFARFTSLPGRLILALFASHEPDSFLTDA